MISNAPWYGSNDVLHKDLKVPDFNDVITEKSINHHIILENHTNTHLNPLLEMQVTTMTK